MNDQRVRPTSAYIHVPFCRHRCGYCNFTVVAGRDDLIGDYLRAIELELQTLEQPQSVHTLFLGGGTPTHLQPDQLERFLALLLHWFPLHADAEFSVEANPEDIDPAKRDILQGSGVNRVSLGVQSFDNDKLKLLERSHHAQDIERCFDLLRPTVDSLSLDLIFGTPDESTIKWWNDLDLALALEPNHISTYGLTYEQGTRFHARKLKDELTAIPEDAEREMYEMAIDRLQAHHFEHYEVSNFATAGHRCRHNENYWLCGEYFGIGPGAASYVSGTRRCNHRSTTSYLKRVLNGESAVVESDELSEKEKAHEFLVFGLRRLTGIDIDSFASRTGYPIDDLVGDNLSWLCTEGLLDRDEQTLRLTRKGLLVSDSIWPYLL